MRSCSRISTDSEFSGIEFKTTLINSTKWRKSYEQFLSQIWHYHLPQSYILRTHSFRLDDLSTKFPPVLRLIYQHNLRMIIGNYRNIYINVMNIYLIYRNIRQALKWIRTWQFRIKYFIRKICRKFDAGNRDEYFRYSGFNT